MFRFCLFLLLTLVASTSIAQQKGAAMPTNNNTKPVVSGNFARTVI